MIGAPPIGGSTPMIALTRWTSATSTISMAQMLSSSSSPADVPRTIASMLLLATGSVPASALVGFSRVSGTISRLIRIAAGAPSTEATTKWPAASGRIGPSRVA